MVSSMVCAIASMCRVLAVSRSIFSARCQQRTSDTYNYVIRLLQYMK